LLDEIDAGVRSIRESCDGVLQQAITSGEVSQMVWTHAQSGKESCVRASRQTGEFHERIEELSRLVRRLEARSREIGQVLLVLNDITEQANLLALNAAIIAAQAGEHGQGFGVVADEMRNLSERASSSTKETEILARTLQEDVAKAVHSMSEAGDTVKRLREALGETQETGILVSDLGGKNVESTRLAREGAERQAAGARDLAGKLRELREEKERLAGLEREVLGPLRETAHTAASLLDETWQLGALRETLRGRLEAGIRAIRDHRGRETRHREELSRHIRDLRETGRAWRSALEDGRRRDDLVRDLARDIQTLSAGRDG
jgi:methyl-accepting chemotaxis protein